MKYQLATEKVSFETRAVLIETNCKDKVNGHEYEFLSKEEAKTVMKALKIKDRVGLWKCTKCKKIKQSM